MSQSIRVEIDSPKPENLTDPHTNTRQHQKIIGSPDGRLHTDAAYLRRLHSFPRLPSYDEVRPSDHTVTNAIQGDGDRASIPLTPRIYDHTWRGGVERVSGGQGTFLVGPEGRGKSTAFRRLAAAEMEHNDSMVVWRGVTDSRSEWLPFAPITRLCVPHGYEVSGTLVPKERSPDAPTAPVDMENVVREVVHYRDVAHLNQEVLEPGCFHVVLPDPQMRGCQYIYEESDKRIANRRTEMEFTSDDPVNHWWFGWGLSTVEMALPGWLAWFCDEVQSLAAEGVANDQYHTRMKVKLLGSSMEDWRKNGVARYFAGHKYHHMHSLWRSRIRFRLHTSGMANPRMSRSSSIPAGMESVPMQHEIIKNEPIGQGVLYDESEFEVIKWPPSAKPVSGDLKVSMNEVAA